MPSLGGFPHVVFVNRTTIDSLLGSRIVIVHREGATIVKRATGATLMTLAILVLLATSLMFTVDAKDSYDVTMRRLAEKAQVPKIRS